MSVKNQLPTVVSSRQIYRSRKNDDSIFGIASQLMRNLDYEFNNMRQSLFKNQNSPKTSAPAENMFMFPPNRLPKSEDLIMADPEGNRKFQLEIDLKGFAPEEINIETNQNVLTVSARKEKEVSL